MSKNRPRLLSQILGGCTIALALLMALSLLSHSPEDSAQFDSPARTRAKSDRVDRRAHILLPALCVGYGAYAPILWLFLWGCHCFRMADAQAARDVQRRAVFSYGALLWRDRRAVFRSTLNSMEIGRVGWALCCRLPCCCPIWAWLGRIFVYLCCSSCWWPAYRAQWHGRRKNAKRRCEVQRAGRRMCFCAVLAMIGIVFCAGSVQADARGSEVGGEVAEKICGTPKRFPHTLSSNTTGV